MLKLYRIPSKEKFMTHIKNSRGDVFLHLSDGSLCSLKTNTTAANLFRMMEIGKNGIVLSFSDPADISGFLQYMMEVAG